MHLLGKALNRIVDVLMWASCVVGALMMVHIAADVVWRNVFNAPLHGTLEIVSAYYMVVIAFFPLAYVSRGEGQIFVDLFTRNLPQRPRRRLDSVVYLVTTAYLAVFAWRSWATAAHKTAEGEVWETAAGFMIVWPSRWLLVAGISVMAVTTLALFLASLRGGGAEREGADT